MVYKGLDASISPATLLSLGRVPMHTVKTLCLERSVHRTASCDLLAAAVAPARLYWLQKEIGCIGLGRARCTDERPNRERVLGFADIAS